MTEQEWREEFAHRLRMIARKKGYYFQKEWADLIGISENTISRYRQSYRTPDAFTIYKLAKALDCTTDELINF